MPDITDKKFEYRCPNCGGTDIEGTAWIHLNSGKESGGDPPIDDDGYYCPDCEEHCDTPCHVNLETGICNFHVDESDASGIARRKGGKGCPNRAPAEPAS